LRVEFEAASGEEALQKLREQPCDVLLLDLSLPGRAGWMCSVRCASATRRSRCWC
jgi:CheY-like chemotaxis protein